MIDDVSQIICLFILILLHKTVCLIKIKLFCPVIILLTLKWRALTMIASEFGFSSFAISGIFPLKQKYYFYNVLKAFTRDV